MEGRVAVVKDIIHNYAKVEYAGNASVYTEMIPQECLDVIDNKKYFRLGSADAL